MAVGIVDLLEAVEIHHADDKTFAGLVPRRTEGARERLRDREPVHEPGQHIDLGEPAAVFVRLEQSDEATVAMPAQDQATAARPSTSAA